VSDSIDLWTSVVVWFVDNCVREAAQVIEAKTMVAVGTALLVLDQKISYALELCEERLRHGAACMLCVVDRGIAKLGLGVRVKPVAHEIRARTRASASAPETIDTSPERTASRLLRASASHAACAGDFGSKLASSLSTSLARSSGGRLNAWAAMSSTGVVMMDFSRACSKMLHPQQRDRPRVG